MFFPFFFKYRTILPIKKTDGGCHLPNLVSFLVSFFFASKKKVHVFLFFILIPYILYC